MRISITHSLVALVLVVGCSADEPGTDVRLLYTEPSEVTTGQTIRGHLFAAGRCLAVVDGRTDTRYELVWPSEGTEWDASTETVTLNGVSATLGDRLTIVGGRTADTGDAGPFAFMQAPPAACVTQSQWSVARLEDVSGPEPSAAER